MSKCERLHQCPFFNDTLENMPTISETLKQTYCLQNKEACARYLLLSAGIMPGPELFPHDSGKAKALLLKSKR